MFPRERFQFVIENYTHDKIYDDILFSIFKNMGHCFLEAMFGVLVEEHADEIAQKCFSELKNYDKIKIDAYNYFRTIILNYYRQYMV